MVHKEPTMNDAAKAPADHVLVLQREIDITPADAWRGWTDPDFLMKWFTPSPWKTVGCEIDLRPGGTFATVMQSPEGQTFPNAGCYLEVVPTRRLVWTSALAPGYRPATETPGVPLFTAILTFEPAGPGTLYTATAVHRDREGADSHAKMGFHPGWGAALDQLVAAVKRG
jgi:uncharacterized protein YndB with AHSA1/START domain